MALEGGERKKKCKVFKPRINIWKYVIFPTLVFHAILWQELVMTLCPQFHSREDSLNYWKRYLLNKFRCEKFHF